MLEMCTTFLREALPNSEMCQVLRTTQGCPEKACGQRLRTSMWPGREAGLEELRTVRALKPLYRLFLSEQAMKRLTLQNQQLRQVHHGMRQGLDMFRSVLKCS